MRRSPITRAALPAAVLAHQGGWDEILFFLGAVGLGWWVLRSTERKAQEGSDRAKDREGRIREPDDNDGG